MDKTNFPNNQCAIGSNKCNLDTVEGEGKKTFYEILWKFVIEFDSQHAYRLQIVYSKLNWLKFLSKNFIYSFYFCISLNYVEY